MPLSRQARVATLALLSAATGLSALAPAPLDRPVRELVGARSSAGANPRYDRPLHGDAIRRAGALLPDGATYYVWAPVEDPTLFGNLKAAAQVFFAPALPVPGPRRARWIFAYERAGLPSGTHAELTIRVGNGIRLVEVSH